MGENLAALLQEAVSLHQSGQIQAAAALYERILAADKRHADACHLLGIILHQANQFDQAEGLIRRAIESRADVANFHNSLGNTLNCLKRYEEAEACFERALQIQPAFPEALYNRAYLEAQRREWDSAMVGYKQAIALRPQYADAHREIANLFTIRGELDLAVEHFMKAIRIQPQRADAFTNLGLVLLWQNKARDAEEVFRRAIQINPDSAKDYDNLGGAIVTQGRYREALECYERALELDPNSAEAHNDIGTALELIGDLDGSTEHFRTTLELRPGFVECFSNLLFGLGYKPDLDPAEHLRIHREWAERYEAPRLAEPVSHRNVENPDRKLRVGYVSPDFRTHSVAYFIEPILEAHDRNEYEVYCYSDVASPDAITHRMEKLPVVWRPIFGKGDDEVSDLILGDGIDILVDLAGHTGRNRLLVFARRPAPIQMAWIGYPNTTGLQSIEYRITDEWADPEPYADTIHSEQLLRLPSGFNCYLPPADSPPVSPLPASHAGSVTFGSFNNFAKINAKVIETWAEILKLTPGSRLLVKCKQMGDAWVREKLGNQFRDLGIREDQLLLLSHIAQTAGHLDAYNLVDVGLDSFPFNGATTSFEALWMGVPIVTLAGDRHAARVGVSILHRLGLDDLIANTSEDYIEIAASLAGRLEELAALRSSMRGRMTESGLTDAVRTTREVEDAYRRAWRERLGLA